MKPVQQGTQVKRRRLLSLLTVLCLLLGGAAAVNFTAASRASGDVSAPAWWGGKVCDNNNYPGSYELGTTVNKVFYPAEYNGVYACGPGTYNQGGTDTPEHFYQGAWGENEWECVELVMRYMYLVYGIAPYNTPGGKDVYGNYPASGGVLSKVPNDGTSLPAPGDILSVGASASNSYGHTGVVTAVNVTSGSGSVTILQQNATANGYGSLTVSGGKITGTVLGGNVTGWLHNPQVSPPTDTDGDGVPDNQDAAPNTPGPVTNRGIPDYSARTTGDFNGDGKQDVATFYDYSGGETKLWLFTGNGDGTFAGPFSVWDSGGQWNWNQTKVVTGDFNGDGKADIAAFYYYGNNETKLYVFYGSASGLSSPTLVWDSDGGLNWDVAKFVAGNFNGDGYTDIAMFYGYSGAETKIFVFYGSASGPTPPTQVWDSGPNSFDWNAIKVVTGDFNGDGRSDIAAYYGFGTSQTKLFEFLGTSTGIAAPFVAWDSGAGGMNWNSVLPVAGDFNGDGKADVGVFYGYSGAETKLFLWNGASSGFASPTQAWDSGAGNWDWNVIKPVAGDFNGDGKADIGVFYGMYNSRVTLNEFQGSSTGFTVVSSAVWDSGVNSWDWAPTLIG